MVKKKVSMWTKLKQRAMESAPPRAKVGTDDVEDEEEQRSPWALTLCDWCGPGTSDKGLTFGPACRRLWCICCHYGRVQAHALDGHCIFWCLSIPLGFGFLLLGWRRQLIREKYTIEGTCLEDYLVCSFVPCCLLCQMIREVEFHDNIDIVDFGLVVSRDSDSDDESEDGKTGALPAGPTSRMNR